jgi:hypothetical protein
MADTTYRLQPGELTENIADTIRWGIRLAGGRVSERAALAAAEDVVRVIAGLGDEVTVEVVLRDDGPLPTD